MKFTPEQVIEMAIESRLNDRLRLDSEAGRILSVQCLERFATLAADRALEAAAHASNAQIERWVDDRARYAASECEAAIRAMKEHQ